MTSEGQWSIYSKSAGLSTSWCKQLLPNHLVTRPRAETRFSRENGVFFSFFSCDSCAHRQAQPPSKGCVLRVVVGKPGRVGMTIVTKDLPNAPKNALTKNDMYIMYNASWCQLREFDVLRQTCWTIFIDLFFLMELDGQIVLNIHLLDSIRQTMPIVWSTSLPHTKTNIKDLRNTKCDRQTFEHAFRLRFPG